MSALFPPWSNTLIRAALFCTAASGGGAIVLLMIYVRTPLYLRQREPIEQPVQFDHRHHVADDQIDCRYCHTSVESAATAGIPAAEICMNCHAQIWNASPLLALVRESFFSNRSIPWRRVHRLPDFVYFDHSIHVRKGVGCVTCHGRVDEMGSVQQEVSLSMGWCLECHRDPEPHLRPREFITSSTWQPHGDPALIGRAVANEYEVRPRTSCTACHR